MGKRSRRVGGKGEGERDEGEEEDEVGEGVLGGDVAIVAQKLGEERRGEDENLGA